MKRSLIILILLFVIVAPVRAATDTVQGRIASFGAANGGWTVYTVKDA